MVDRALPGLVGPGTIGATPKQDLDHRHPAQFRRDHQRGLAAIVGGVNRSAAVEQKLDHLNGSARIDSVLVARGPHQCGQVVAVSSLRIHTLVE